ncbi:hypothetical protein EP331_14890 [bacterium]|nr:MAG: hypothetical protein EP331_14890 [bacterium]
MKKNTFNLLFLLLMGVSAVSAQSQLQVGPNAGLFILNSENFKPITKTGNFIINYGFDISFLKDRAYNQPIQFDYSFVYSKIVADKIPITDERMVNIGTINLYESLMFNTIDVLFIKEWKKSVSIGHGPSLSIVNRTVKYNRSDFFLEDRLMALNVGYAGTAYLQHVIENQKVYVGLKVRYLYGLLYDARGRNLSDYNQHFITLSLMAGMTYSF